MCLHTTPFSCVIIVHNSLASATCSLSWTQCSGLVASFPSQHHQQFCKLQAGPHHPSTNTQGVPPAVMQKTILTPLRADKVVWWSLCLLSVAFSLASAPAFFVPLPLVSSGYFGKEVSKLVSTKWMLSCCSHLQSTRCSMTLTSQRTCGERLQW